MFVLNTRPKNQSNNLNTLIKNSGGNFFNLPAIEIIPVPFEKPDLNHIDFLIFSSANAVQYFFNHINQKDFSCKLIAIGPATKMALEKLGFKNIIIPNNFNSNSILDLAILSNINHKNILIISGENPKLILFENLKSRGANVSNIYCYKRICPKYNMDIVFSVLTQKNINIIVSTSLENLKNLLLIFKDHLHWLLEKKLCVISSEMRDFATKNGFTEIILAENATDEAIIQSLI